MTCTLAPMPNMQQSLHRSVINPVRLNHWLQVDPLESLAGIAPDDDMVVMVEKPRSVLWKRQNPCDPALPANGSDRALLRAGAVCRAP
jgi:predicted Abi (CAAX) family protease